MPNCNWWIWRFHLDTVAGPQGFNPRALAASWCLGWWDRGRSADENTSTINEQSSIIIHHPFSSSSSLLIMNRHHHHRLLPEKVRLFYDPNWWKRTTIIGNVFHSPVPTLMPRRSRWKIQELAWSFSEVRYAHHGVFHTLLRGLQVSGWLVARNYRFWKHPNKNHTKSLTDPGAVPDWCGVLGRTAECQHVGLDQESHQWEIPYWGCCLCRFHCLKNELHHGFILRCLIRMPTSQRGSGPIFPRIHGMSLTSFFPR